MQRFEFQVCAEKLALVYLEHTSAYAPIGKTCSRYKIHPVTMYTCLQGPEEETVGEMLGLLLQGAVTASGSQQSSLACLGELDSFELLKL